MFKNLTVRMRLTLLIGLLSILLVGPVLWGCRVCKGERWHGNYL